MRNYVIIGILLIILILVVLRSKKHIKGRGRCGSGSNTIRDKKEAERIGNW